MNNHGAIVSDIMIPKRGIEHGQALGGGTQAVLASGDSA